MAGSARISAGPDERRAHPGQAAPRERIVRFARGPETQAAQRDQSAVFDRAGRRVCAEFGVLSRPIPREYGGGGPDLLTATIAFGAPLEPPP
ncbi:acyl-CoA dehydrogenase family protein [Nonomuraea typhae]|uniref:acyl-CoA dehydrogenase family protein n=1 Tax=Nonomuraea typhae TaxID=2603600 RepID=UPI0012FA153D|nr:acyl-CoA dehydrogenase family protein [Nonomuraea typhae]